MKNEILAKVIERAASIWGKDTQELSGDTTFAELNAKSGQLSQMTTFLEDEFDVEVPYMGFKRCKTFDEAAEYVDGLLDS